MDEQHTQTPLSPTPLQPHIPLNPFSLTLSIAPFFYLLECSHADVPLLTINKQTIGNSSQQPTTQQYLLTYQTPLFIQQYFSMPNPRYFFCLLMLLTLVQSDSCPNPTLIVPDTFLDGIFDKVMPSFTYQTQLRAFITDPTMQTARTYITTQSNYLITLWVFACLSLVMLVGCCIQICCYNCCHSNKCGKKIALNTYSPASVSCCVYLFMFFALLLTGLAIAAFIISADLLANLNDTTCDVNTTFDYLFDGTPVGFSPQWSGADNFNSFAQNLSINFPNAMPTLLSVFSSTQYSLVTGNGSGSLYANSQTYACPSASAGSTVACPFGSVSSCAGGTATQIPIFSQEYCNSSVSTSSAALIASEQTNNSTKWQNALLSLNTQISNAVTSPVSFSNLVDQTSTLSSSFSNFKPGLSSGIDGVNKNFHLSKIGSYIFYSAIILIGLLSFLTSCCVFCTRNFNCRYLLFFYWVLFAILAIIFFLASSVLLFGSFTTFGSCIAYNYYTTTPGAFQTISYYNTSQIAQILNTCFITSPNGNIFNTFNQTNLPTVQAIKTSYYSSLPSVTFTTVANNITNTLGTYAANPNTVTLLGATTDQNPQAALTSLNTFAASSSYCGFVGSSYQYNPLQCNPNLINQANSASCIIINTANTPTTTGSLSCTVTDYTALLSFGTDVQALASGYISDAGLQGYRTAYFNYYEGVSTLMNNFVQSLFNSFLQPYQSLLDGSSCSFLTVSLNSLINTSCNRDFPQIYAVSVLITAMAACFFFLMILAYFLTTRLEFYAFLNGDLSNYNPEAPSQADTQAVEIEMASVAKTGRSPLLAR